MPIRRDPISGAVVLEVDRSRYGVLAAESREPIHSTGPPPLDLRLDPVGQVEPVEGASAGGLKITVVEDADPWRPAPRCPG